MKETLVSIIMPIYKTEDYVEKSVNSLLTQTYKNLEIILVDDGSPDRCPEICDNLAKQDKRIKVIHKENGGPMSAWLEGLKISKGNYITFVDSDDWAEPNYIEELYKPYAENPEVDLTICKYYRATDTDKVVGPATKDDLTGLITGAFLEDYKKTKVRNFTVFKGNKLFKREALLNNLKYCDPRIIMGDDICIALSTILDSKNIFIIDKPLYNYYNRPTSIVNSYKEKLILQNECLYYKYNEVLKDKNYYTEINSLMEHIVSVFGVVENLICSNKKNKRKIFKSFYKSILFKELFKRSLKPIVSKKHKLFVMVLKTRSYLLAKAMIKFNKSRNKD